MLDSFVDSLLEFLRQSPEKAYWGVLFGSMVEGEMIILTASALAAAGYLSIYKVGSIAFLSTLLVDQILFFIGHYFYKKPRQRPLSERFPKLYKKSRRAVVLLKKYDIWFILSFRFIYGIRAVSPVVIGLCGSSPSRFVPLNAVSALIWAVISCSLGYSLGDFLFDENGRPIPDHMRYLQCIILGILLLGIGILVFTIIKRRRDKRNKEALERRS